jgi:predicted GNAT family acetyltransferase
MEVRERSDPAAFAETAGLLLRAPARHNLMLGLCDLLCRHPEIYPTFHLWTIRDGTAPVGAALRTPPHNLVVAEPLDAGAISVLASHLAASADRLPGVVGALPEAAAFADAWTALAGGEARTSTRQGVYELREVRDIGGAAGAARLAVDGDLDLLVRWHEDFVAEAVPDHIGDESMRRRRLEGAIRDEEYWIWEVDGRPVSMTGASPAPPDGSRVGPVYTPPADRGNGYATALVAHVSAAALDAGRSACYLHTDLSNPTSNEIYKRVGYDWVCEAVDLRFVGQSQSGGTGA